MKPLKEALGNPLLEKASRQMLLKRGLGAKRDTRETHAAALRYVDGCLPPLFAAFRRRGKALCIVCSDHGSAYGEDDLRGHRVAHPVVWTVPYAEWVWGEDV